MLTDEDLQAIKKHPNRYRVDGVLDELTKEWQYQSVRCDYGFRTLERHIESLEPALGRKLKEAKSQGRISSHGIGHEDDVVSEVSQLTDDLMVFAMLTKYYTLRNSIREGNHGLKSQLSSVNRRRLLYRILPFVVGFAVFLITDYFGPLLGLSGESTSGVAAIIALLAVYIGEHLLQSNIANFIRSRLTLLVGELRKGIRQYQIFNERMEKAITRMGATLGK